MPRCTLVLVGAGLLIAALVNSCGSDQAAGATHKTIAVLPKGTQHEFWKSVHAGALKAAEEFGVEILWQGPTREDDRAAQISVVENAINSSVDGIVLAPLDDQALVPVVTEAVREGIPVIIFDSGINTEDYVSFIATDNFKGGEIAGERLGQLLGGTGKALMLRFMEGSASTEKREAGFLKVMNEKYPNIELVSTDQYGGNATEAQAASENLLTRFGDDLDGIFCPNESTVFGMLLALRDAGLAGKIKFVGFDSTTKLAEALQQGHIHGLVLQNPFAMGEQGVRSMMAHLAGDPVDKRIDTGAHLATKDNMEDTEIRQLLRPDLSEWLDR